MDYARGVGARRTQIVRMSYLFDGMGLGALPTRRLLADPRAPLKGVGIMTNNFDRFDEFQKFAKGQIEAASTAAASLAKGFQTIAAETTDYSKKSLEANSAYVEKLLGAKSLDDAIQTQSEYAKSAYEGFVTQATKIGEIYTNLAKEAFKPVESMIAKVQAAADPTKVQAAAAPTKGYAAAE